MIVFEKMTRTKNLTNAHAHADAHDQVTTIPRLFSSKGWAKKYPEDNNMAWLRYKLLNVDIWPLSVTLTFDI